MSDHLNVNEVSAPPVDWETILAQPDEEPGDAEQLRTYDPNPTPRDCAVCDGPVLRTDTHGQAGPSNLCETCARAAYEDMVWLGEWVDEIGGGAVGTTGGRWYVGVYYYQGGHFPSLWKEYESAARHELARCKPMAAVAGGGNSEVMA